MLSRRRALGFLAMTAATSLAPAAAQEVSYASRIAKVVSPGGIEAWLVRQTHLPIVALSFAMRGGSAQDPVDRLGAVNLMAGMLDEGAGDLDAEAFNRRLEDRAIQLTVSASRDTLSGSVRTLSEHRGEAFRLLGLALAAPRFDAAPLARVREAVLSGIRRASTNPNNLAGETFAAMAYPDHPYGRRGNGTVESVEALTAEDLKVAHRRIVAREHLKVTVVGDITPEDLARELDAVFGPLPARATLTEVPVVTPRQGERRVIAMDVPQTVISFGLPGLLRADPDFIPAFLMNHILGGGSFSSRLYREVREARGLAYSVWSSLTAMDFTGLINGGTSTRNDRAAQSIAVIEAEFRRMGEEGPTALELEQAKRYLIGNWAMRFETSTQIAAGLIRVQLDGFEPDYLDKRNGLIDAVTIDEVNRVAKRLLGDPRLLIAAVGKPEGL